MRLLVTGAGGMLGQDVVRAAEAAGHEPIALPHAELDITDPDAVGRALTRELPAAVVNCAAWTDVDGAEEHEAAVTLPAASMLIVSARSSSSSAPSTLV